MEIETLKEEDGCTFYFGIGILQTVKVTEDNRFIINGYERPDFYPADQRYAKKQNLVPQKEHLSHPFYTGDDQQPILTASRGLDGRIFVRIYRDERHFRKFRERAEWIGSYWHGEVREWDKKGEITKYKYK